MKQKPKIDFMLVMLCLLAGVILFTNLGNIYLWQDEATTAVLAKNTLEFGIPRTFDGTNLITTIYSDPCKYSGWKYAPWFQFYLAALSFYLFGVSTFAARLPFAVFGMGSLILCYLLAQRLFQNRLLSRLSTAFMLFSAPFFLYMRQCRWYGLSVFFTLWILISYLDMIKKKRFSAWGFVLASSLLFHSNYAIFFPVLGAMCFHYLVFHKKDIELKRILGYLSIIAILTVPFFLYSVNMECSGQMTFLRTKGHLEFYVRVLNKYLFPLVFLFLSLAVFSFFKKKVFPVLDKALDRSRLWFFPLVFIFTICFLLLAEERQLRYLIHLLPLSCILMSFLMIGWLKLNIIVAGLVFVVACFTNSFHTGSPFAKKLWIPIVDIAYELTHDYDGPVEGIIKFLNKNARPGDTVKLIMGDCAVMFYTDFKVDNEDFTQESFPEWIIVRNDWVSFKSLSARYRRQIESQYQRIELNYPDIMWENRPDPGYHKFKTVTDWPTKVTVYKKR